MTCSRMITFMLMGFLAMLIPAAAFADPVVRFELVDPSTPATNINDFREIERFADFSEVFHNNTGMTFTDFHIHTFNATNMPLTVVGGGFFGRVQIMPTGEFVTLWLFQDGGTGIPNSTRFRVTAQGFNVPGVEPPFFRMTPSSIPEPATIVLLGTGLASVAVKVRKRRKT